jgi:hypothetical protein
VHMGFCLLFFSILAVLLLTNHHRSDLIQQRHHCQYCSTDFKNKNELKRHESSQHSRQYWWLCAALANIHAVFHPTSTHPGALDLCGYCGNEFANPPDWHARSKHLYKVHRFGECQQTKKFFRADHFRQHLKSSHAGISGKWMKILEVACKKAKPAARNQCSNRCS